MVCPLCAKTSKSFGSYRRCNVCHLIFRHEKDRPTPALEKRTYDFHQNSPANKGYVTFLRGLADPLCHRLRNGSRGLDYGCGPGPTLDKIIESQTKKKDVSVDLYDPYYFPKKTFLNHEYDFVACTEVAEHFFNPRKEFDLLRGLLRPGGVLAVMTQLTDSFATPNEFENWWYQRDPTHVSFYSRETFRWIGRWTGQRVEFLAKNVVFLTS